MLHNFTDFTTGSLMVVILYYRYVGQPLKPSYMSAVLSWKCE